MAVAVNGTLQLANGTQHAITPSVTVGEAITEIARIGSPYDAGSGWDPAQISLRRGNVELRILTNGADQLINYVGAPWQIFLGSVGLDATTVTFVHIQNVREAVAVNGTLQWANRPQSEITPSVTAGEAITEIARIGSQHDAGSGWDPAQISLRRGNVELRILTNGADQLINYVGAPWQIFLGSVGLDATTVIFFV